MIGIQLMIVLNMLTHRHLLIEALLTAVHNALEGALGAARVTRLQVRVHAAREQEALLAIWR